MNTASDWLNFFLLKRSIKSLASHLSLLSGYTMQKSRTELNKYCREWRKVTHEEKRFNKPLRIFLELKYRDVINEYRHFFNSLNQQYPEAKDLTKTKGFKAWKTRQLNCESSDEETSNRREPDESDETDLNLSDRAESEQNEGDALSVACESTDRTESEQNEGDTLSVACEETIPINLIDRNDLPFDQVDAIIQQVIDELEQDEGIRELLNNGQQVETQDEGIELDTDIELAGVVEPFDYELEVEGIDW